MSYSNFFFCVNIGTFSAAFILSVLFSMWLSMRGDERELFGEHDGPAHADEELRGDCVSQGRGGGAARAVLGC